MRYLVSLLMVLLWVSNDLDGTLGIDLGNFTNKQDLLNIYNCKVVPLERKPYLERATIELCLILFLEILILLNNPSKLNQNCASSTI